MNTRLLAPILGSLFLTGCGALVSNTDAAPGLNLAGAAPVEAGASVEVVEAVPTGVETAELSGISCKNKFWDPPPSDGAAVATLRREVEEAGFDSVVVSRIEPVDNPIVLNCWSAIAAYGTAFNAYD